jgi:DNA repair exonuclease SbcCD ATPase subunit
MKIAHTADIQIRFGARHDEFRDVFERFYEDLRNQKPDRIYVGGDLMHHKIKTSPQSSILLVSFLTELSKIAPTDVILGNHDLNLQNLDQGDIMAPILETARMLDAGEKAVTVTEENKDDVDFWKNSIYYYPSSGFFDVGRDLVYGIYSCVDNEVLKLETPEARKTYVAFWHGTLYGSVGDNGYEIRIDDGFNMETFKNFDAVMMGDIHEYQTFREDETIAYCGSLIQNNYGESIDKGYLMWDLSNKKNITHQRRYVLNDWGFAKLNISRGESIEERVENLNFSNDKKKTKISIVYEDYQENYSLERERYIRDLIRNQYGCKEINISFEAIEKEEIDVLDGKEVEEGESLLFLDLLEEWLDQTEGDISDEEKKNIIKLASDIDNSELEIDETKDSRNRTNIEPLKITFSNLFSFPEKALTIDLQRYQGILGIFGKNYSGKSNLIRTIIWGMFEVVPGNKDSNTIVNLYTESNKGFVSIELLINGVLHRISRRIEQKEKGSNSYRRKFEIWKEVDTEGVIEEKWVPVKSDSGTSEQKEVKKQIEEAIGSYEDFSINSLHIHGSEDDYINLSQQDKNSLFWKYNGLDPFKQRVAYARKKINVFKKSYSDLGKAVEIEQEIATKEEELKAKRITLDSLGKEKKMNETRREDENKKIINLTSKLEKVQILPFENKEEIEKKISDITEKVDRVTKIKNELQGWVDINPKRELPFDSTKTIDSVSSEIDKNQSLLDSSQTEKGELKIWIESNPRKEVIDDSGASKVIMEVQSEVISLQNDLIIFQGKPCPTCNNATSEPKPKAESSTKILIGEKNVIINEKRKLIEKAEDHKNHNNLLNQKESRLSLLISSIKQFEGALDSLNKEKDVIAKSKSIIEHNTLYDRKYKDLRTSEGDLQNFKNSLAVFQNQFDVFDENEENKKKNIETEKYITDIEESIDQYKLAVHAISNQINGMIGDVSVLENTIQTSKVVLNKIKEADKNFKIYSIYLQAVERDGIPSMIIKKRLPLMNSRVNSLIGHMANYKVDLEIDKKGDIKEYFYFMENKFDRLPVAGSGSGAQKFLISLAIKDAFRYISGNYVVKPSIFLIDEGFGTLHPETVTEMVGILRYLKTKYKNMMVITHVDEIKDAADYIFEAFKDRTELTEEDLNTNPNAGITQLVTR